jgi:hypothetical protein
MHLLYTYGSENALKVSGSSLGQYKNYTKLSLFQGRPGAGSEMKNRDLEHDNEQLDQGYHISRREILGLL